MLYPGAVTSLETLGTKWGGEEWSMEQGGWTPILGSKNHFQWKRLTPWYVWIPNRGSTFHSRREEATSFVPGPTLAFLAILLNLTAHVNGDKASAGLRYVPARPLQDGGFQWLFSGRKAEGLWDGRISISPKASLVFPFKLTAWSSKPETGEESESKCVLYVLTQFVLKLFTLARCQVFAAGESWWRKGSLPRVSWVLRKGTTSTLLKNHSGMISPLEAKNVFYTSISL